MEEDTHRQPTYSEQLRLSLPPPPPPRFQQLKNLQMYWNKVLSGPKH
jgi:hypothetical protein